MNEKDEEILEEDEIDDEEAEVEDVDDDPDDDDEFEYDEDGNIIIPEVEFDDGEEETEEVTEEETEEETEEVTEETAEEPTEDTDDVEEAVEDSDEVTKLRQELAMYKSQVKDTLKDLGVEDEDDIHGLATLSAEANGVGVDTYLQNRAEEHEKQVAVEALRRQKFENQARADLEVLHQIYPETSKYSHLSEMPEDMRRIYGRCREQGLDPKSAYAAANPDGIRKAVAESTKKQSLNSKEHLRSSVPKSAKTGVSEPTAREMKEWRNLFPKASDAEIKKLFAQTASKK